MVLCQYSHTHTHLPRNHNPARLCAGGLSPRLLGKRCRWWGTLEGEASAQRAHVVFVFLCTEAAIQIWEGKRLWPWNQRSIYPITRCTGLRFIENISPEVGKERRILSPRRCVRCVLSSGRREEEGEGLWGDSVDQAE